MPEPDFVLGELLEWRNRVTPDGQITRRPVSFMGWKNHQAIISFGLLSDGTGQPNVFLVPPDELLRPTPAVVLKPEVPVVAPPPVPLIERRESLAQAYQRYCEAEQDVFEAQDLLDRALLRVEQAQHHVNEYRDLETHAANAVLHSLKHVNGTNPIADDDEEWQARERAQRDVRAAESAYDQLAKELADTKAIMFQREQVLHRLASFVVAGVVDRETMRLAELEQTTAELRTTLKAASYLWFADQTIPIDRASAKTLTEPPCEVHEGVGERLHNTALRQRGFEDLFTRLVSGDTEAELSWHFSDEVEH